MIENDDTLPPEDMAAPPAADALEVLRAALVEAENRAAAAKDAQLRTAAETENLRRRLDRDALSNLKYANEKILSELLAIADSLELGLHAAGAPDAQVKAIIEGMQLTHRQLMATLEKHGVKQLDPQGEPFNPDAHQAMSMVASVDVAPNHVVEVLQKGYKLHDRLLRPAMVMVAKAPA